MKSKVYLTVVVTALNEENNVENCVKKLTKFLDNTLEQYQIIFVNDGSTDGTADKLNALLKTENFKVIHLDYNHGTGGAIKAAIPHITGDWYCWLPSDMEILPDELLKPIELCEGKDIVVTYISNGHLVRSILRNSLSKLFIKIMNLTFGTKLNYFNGVSLIKTSLIKDLNVQANRFFFHAELLLHALQISKNYTQTAILLTPRFADSSKAMKPQIFIDVLICYLRNFWQLKVRKKASRA